MPDRIEIVEGDITRLDVDAIVNAANSTLARRRWRRRRHPPRRGPELAAACAQLGGCDTGEAKITPGFRLPARYVIHTVGPVWGGGERGEDRLLAGCYRNSLALAAGAWPRLDRLSRDLDRRLRLSARPRRRHRRRHRARQFARPHHQSSASCSAASARNRKFFTRLRWPRRSMRANSPAAPMRPHVPSRGHRLGLSSGTGQF